ncbi:MAG: hypothetical protein Q8P41_19325 [Pseudomonadota bacterium]|nr:hypothetical protein [Pseudomonadota bacterium]
MEPTDFTVLTYATYLLLSISLTVWVARTLVKNGRIFLVDAFGGNEPLADSVNHLLGVGFYLVNLGYVSLKMQTYESILSYPEVFEVVASKVGLVMLALGFMHFFNLFVFSRLRRRGMMHLAPPPVLPNEFLAPRTAAKVA